MTKLRPLQYSVGYGAAKYDPERKVWLAHAVSSIVFDIPNGNWKLKGTGTPGGVPAQSAMTQKCGHKKSACIRVLALLRLSWFGPPSPFADVAATGEG